ncbi:3237_t:CDS:1, partial [Scutellospora calospora]
FSQDIAVTSAFQFVKLNLWISFVNKYEIKYPNYSHNKAISNELEIVNNFIELNTLNHNKANIIKNDNVINNNNYNDINNNNDINNTDMQPSFFE